MKAIRIVQCSDSMMWYRDKVGHIVDFLHEDDQYYWSREPAGYSNIIKRQDGEIVECKLNDAQLSWVCNFIMKVSCNNIVLTTFDDGLVRSAKETIVKQLKEAHGKII